MLAATDYVGIAAVISATAAAIVSIVVAFRQNGTVRKVDDVHAAVTMSNGTTLGGAVEEIGRAVAPPDATPVP